MPIKISIVTAVLNRERFIAGAIASVQKQSHKNLELIVIDGVSTDGTLAQLHRCLDERSILITEPDEGLYDALNKGFARATGDVVGVMHSDDFFADTSVLASVAERFSDVAIDAVYGDLEYVAQDDTKRVIRYWKAGDCTPSGLAWGWMPPHPTLFLRRQVIQQWGGFDTNFRIAADYDLILRYFGRAKIRSAYIPRVLVKMRVGGESNRSLDKILLKSREDYSALRRNGVGGVGALMWKNLSKVRQFLCVNNDHKNDVQN